MIEPKNPVFINYLGEIPVNPDDLPERSFVTGRGSDRPIGFTFDKMYQYYWNTRFFKFNFNGFLPPRDQVADFLMGGGSLAGLAIVSAWGALPQAFSSAGTTQIQTISRVKNRIKDQFLNKIAPGDLDNINLAQKPDLSKRIPGDPNGPYAEKVLHIRRNKNNGKTGSEYRPVQLGEGDLVSAGPIHFGNSQGSGLIIDFSNIIFYKRLYWPRIIAFTPWGASFAGYSAEYEDEYGYKPSSFRLGYRGLTSNNAFITFDGGQIDILYAPELQVGQTGLRGILGPFINGAITTKFREEEECCSKFYYDNSDEYRLANAGSCKGCEKQGVGLKID